MIRLHAADPDDLNRKLPLLIVSVEPVEGVKPTPVIETDYSEYFVKQTFDTDPQKGCELLFRHYFRALCTHAVRYVYSRQIAEDLVSDVFYTFWNTQAYKSVTTSFRAYLFRSVRNRAYNYLAHELNRSDSLDKASDQESDWSDWPEQMMQFEELSQKIDALVASLPPQCQKIFLMNRFEGKKNKDIADDLHISIRTVESHLQKAIQTLRSGLKDALLWIAFFMLASNDCVKPGGILSILKTALS